MTRTEGTGRAPAAGSGALRRTAVALLAVAAIGVGACGADDEPSAPRASTTATTAVAAEAPDGSAAPAQPTATTATTATATTTAASPSLTGNDEAEDARVRGDGEDNPCSGAIDAPTSLTGETNVDAPGATPLTTAATTAPDDGTTSASTSTTPGAVTTTPSPGDPADATAPTSEPRPALDARASEQAALQRPFANSSPWNVPIDTAAVDPRSDDWIARAAVRVAVVAAADRRSVTVQNRRARDLGLYINTCAWTPAIVSVRDGESVRVVCRQRNCGPVARELQTLRMPSDVEPFPEYDGWFSVIDEASGVGYDFWRARRVGNVLSYHFVKRWRLDGPGFSPPATENPTLAVGARGSGLPLFAGVINADDLDAGRIDHALAISLPGPAQRIFVQPASVTNGLNVLRSLPMGARLRLKASAAPPRIPRGANRRSAYAIMAALRTYGAIVVDRSTVPTLYARRSRGSDDRALVGNELQGISLTDLEVVSAPPLLRYPPLGSTDEEVQG